MHGTPPRSCEEAFTDLQASREAGLAFFFDHYYVSLTYYAAKITGDEAFGQEIASEAFIKLWQKRARLEASSYIKPLLYRMVHNAAVDHLRQQRAMNKRQEGYRYANNRNTQSVEQITFGVLVETGTYAKLYTHLQALPPRTQEIFRLFYYQHKSIKEIAARLGVSVNTVKTLKLRAVQQLRTVRLMSFVFGLFTLLVNR